MVGTKGKSGGKRDGAGHPTLAEQLRNTAKAIDEANFAGDVEELARLIEQAKALQKKIEKRYASIIVEIEQLEAVQHSQAWRLVNIAASHKGGG